MKITKLHKITAAVAVGALLSVGAAYIILHSPKYTLYKIKQSLNDHDWEAFSKYVDVDATYSSLISSIDKGNDNPLGAGIAKAMAGAMKETIIAQIKSQVENPKNDGKEGELLSTFALPDSVKPKIEIIKSGKVASVRIYSNHGLIDIPAYLEIQMRSEGWKYVVIGINRDNIEQRTKIVDEALEKFYTIPARQKISNSATIKFSAVRKGCANGFYGTCFEDLILVDRIIKNTSQKEITRIEYKICPRNTSNQDECKYAVDESIKPGEEKSFGKTSGWKYNQFISEQKAILNTSAESLEAIPSKIVFADNDSIEVSEIAYLLAEKHPTIDELSKFMKANSLEYADSVITWSHDK